MVPGADVADHRPALDGGDARRRFFLDELAELDGPGTRSRLTEGYLHDLARKHAAGHARIPCSRHHEEIGELGWAGVEVATP